MHPLSPSVKRQLRIEHNNISHIVQKVWFEGNLLYGEVETALTEQGKNMQGLIRQGMQVAFSLRGFGKVTEQKNNILYVRDPLNILSYDWVIHPSHEKAYMTKILREDRDIDDDDEENEDDERVYDESAYFQPISNTELSNYLNESSENLKNFKKQLNFTNPKLIGKEKDDNLVYFEESNRIVACYLDEYNMNEIDNYLKNL